MICTKFVENAFVAAAELSIGQSIPPSYLSK